MSADSRKQHLPRHQKQMRTGDPEQTVRATRSALPPRTVTVGAAATSSGRPGPLHTRQRTCPALPLGFWNKKVLAGIKAQSTARLILSNQLLKLHRSHQPRTPGVCCRGQTLTPSHPRGKSLRGQTRAGWTSGTHGGRGEGLSGDGPLQLDTEAQRGQTLCLRSQCTKVGV